MNLDDCHIIVVSHDDKVRQRLQDTLTARGATPHAVCNRTQALGMLVELFAHRIIPRAFITDWTLCPPASDEAKFYSLLGRDEEATGLPLIRHLREFDKTIAIVVRASVCDDIPQDILVECEFQVVDTAASDDDLIATMLADPRMSDMRAAKRHRSRELSLP